jgi:tetratricopeptide (TPR) repeat protein
VHQRLGAAYGFVGDSREAFKQFQLALDTGQRAGDMRILAQTHRLLAWAWIENDGEYERAIHEGHRALEFYAELDEPTAKARALETVGFCAAKLGRLAEAREFCSQALDLCRTADSLNAKATVLGSLGFIERSSGDLPASLVYAEQSLSLFIDNGNLWQAAEQLVELGHTYAALSRRADAISTWRRAYQQLHSQHRLTHAAAVLTLLAAADKGVD